MIYSGDVWAICGLSGFLCEVLIICCGLIVKNCRNPGVNLPKGFQVENAHCFPNRVVREDS